MGNLREMQNAEYRIEKTEYIRQRVRKEAVLKAPF